MGKISVRNVNFTCKKLSFTLAKVGFTVHKCAYTPNLQQLTEPSDLIYNKHKINVRHLEEASSNTGAQIVFRPAWKTKKCWTSWSRSSANKFALDKPSSSSILKGLMIGRGSIWWWETIPLCQYWCLQCQAVVQVFLVQYWCRSAFSVRKQWSNCEVIEAYS